MTMSTTFLSTWTMVSAVPGDENGWLWRGKRSRYEDRGGFAGLKKKDVQTGHSNHRKTDLCSVFVDKYEGAKFLNFFVDIREHPTKFKVDGGGDKRGNFFRELPTSYQPRSFWGC